MTTQPHLPPEQSARRVRDVAGPVAATMLLFLLSACSVPNPSSSELPRASQSSLDAAAQAVVHSYGEHESQIVRVLSPNSGGSNRRVVLYLHGGGWTGGSPAALMPRVFHDLRDRGYTIVQVGYRLAPDAPWPAQIQDVKLATRWVEQNSTQLKVNPKMKVIAGFSAGGHLAALAGATPGRWEPDGKRTTYDMIINCAGVGDAVSYWKWDGYNVRHALRALLGPAPSTADLRSISPSTFATADDPTLYSIHGTSDGIVPIHQSIALSLNWHRAHGNTGRSVWLDVVEGGSHAPTLKANMTVLEMVLDQNVH